ncbi:MAG: 50S ribosomal protein L23 [Candidatus Yonathbacteria bacterium]|nr:50S ribosomal protein L23 [Candidatus Yonathbacteria bacterium]
MSTTTKKTTKKAAGTPRVAKVSGTPGTYAHILRTPRITEKATDSASRGAYVFNVDMRATKPEIIKAIKEVYGVEPVRVNITTVSAKRVVVRGRLGVRSGGKKATVFLKKGETIEIV